MKQETIDRIRKFTEDRDWEQFHSPANLAKSIVIEAAEFWDRSNWQPLCEHHHNVKTMTEDRFKEYRF
jgi:hypothetical protein